MAKTIKIKYDIEKFNKIKEDLNQKLENSGCIGKYFEDLIDDYMNLWLTKEGLSNDIKSRGVVVVYDNGGGQKGKKKNDSVSELVKVNQQMLKLLFALNLTPQKEMPQLKKPKKKSIDEDYL